MSTMEQMPVLEKYQPYPEYSNSKTAWIGDIPSTWSLKRVKHTFTIRKRIAGQLGFDILSVTQRGIVVKDIESGDGQLSMDYSKYQRVMPGDFAMNHMDLLTGYVDISAFNGVTSPDYRVFTINQKLYSPRYFLYLFQMGYQLKIFFHMGQGASHLGRWRLATDEFNDMVFPVPSPLEQRTIAAFLDYETARIDKLIAQQQRLIELLKEKRQAVISHAVTKGLNPDAPMKDSGVEWLGEVPEHWIVAGFKKYIEPIVDYRGKTPTKTESGVFLVTARNIKNGIIDYSLSEEFISDEDYEEVMRRGKPKIGDVLFTTEAPLGEVAQIDNENIALAQRIIKFRGKSNVLDCSYLKLFIQSTEFQQGLMTFATGSTALGIKSDRLSYLKQFVPPLTEQTQIVEAVKEHSKKYEKLIEVASQAIEHMQERRTALVSAAVTGKIDLRGWAALTKEVSNG
ncbi:TPA: restriction endonuclease subunit S [Klebsiella pneumoniae]|uniref:restriction endonuclease subunit S n=1 Tax=Klebsiella pneumoniae TaxID=573 RepID=UPI000E2A6C9F|nr:putative restriction endonuclease S subunit [Klebsiella pneumoniae]HBR1282304.1 restriction endonuclease subunit S [Klebsiella pneumoniae]HDU1485869.1 restriction endonuclease subunit S [Klebsiella pneumoniae]HDU2393826.1 restriction endonuclease subunit S [Klebsiella pneumoniae]